MGLPQKTAHWTNPASLTQLETSIPIASSVLLKTAFEPLPNPRRGYRRTHGSLVVA